jgi:hypothetical protein
MESKYSIVMEGACQPLFKVEYEFKNEGPAVLDFGIKMAIERDLAAEDAIRDLYAKFHGRHDSISDPVELLGILLANGATLRTQKGHEQFDLFKDHFPISFEASSGESNIKIVTLAL